MSSNIPEFAKMDPIDKIEVAKVYAILSQSYAIQARTSEFIKDEAIMKSMAAGLRSREILASFGLVDATLEGERETLQSLIMEPSEKESK